MYEHRYKHGKQKSIMPLAAFQAAIGDAINQGAPLNWLAFAVLLWHTGVRKSEAYERLLSDVTVTKEFIIVDFHKRKKGGEEVEPLSIPRSFYGVEEFLLPWIEQRQKAKPPRRETWKTIFRQVETGEFRQTEPTARNPNGLRCAVKKTVGEKRRGWWLFPHIQSKTAWNIIKAIFGEEYYPHYFRLRKLSRAAEGGENWFDAQDRIRKISGLRTVNAREAYIGTKADSKQIMRDSE